MPAPTYFHQENSLSGAPVPSTTDNSTIPRFEEETTRIDVRHLLIPDLTPESEHGFSGMGQPGHAPITPSPQSSPTGAQYGRTPLPNAPVTPPFSVSSGSSVVNFDALEVLATVASTRDRAANLPAQAPRGLKECIETVMEEHGRPMTSAAVHRAVLALGGHGYKFQTVRKALSNKKGPFMPLGKSNKVKWALKTWDWRLVKCRANLVPAGAQRRRERDGRKREPPPLKPRQRQLGKGVSAFIRICSVYRRLRDEWYAMEALRERICNSQQYGHVPSSTTTRATATIRRRRHLTAS